jgi:proline iminopeptidase
MIDIPPGLMDERAIKVTGGTVRAWVHGSGRPGIPLLVLHGGPGAPHDYLEPLAALADERPVIFCDQLGCGASDRLNDRSLWRWPVP